MSATFLLEGITSADVIISIEETLSLPYSGVIRIENELISYTDNFSGTLYNCVRGYQGTTASSHARSSLVDFLAYYSPSTGVSVSTNTVTPVSLDTTNVWKNYLTITLTPGDWDVTGVIQAYRGFSNAEFLDGAISLYSGNITTDIVYGLNAIEINTVSGHITTPIIIANYKIEVFQDTTIYLKGFSSWDNGTAPEMYNGSLRARRFR